MTTPTEAERMAALRQYSHNDYSGFVIGYDKDTIDRLLAALEKENAELRQKVGQMQFQAYELDGVILDVEQGNGFDEVCLNTIKRVRKILKGQP